MKSFVASLSVFCMICICAFLLIPLDCAFVGLVVATLHPQSMANFWDSLYGDQR